MNVKTNPTDEVKSGLEELLRIQSSLVKEEKLSADSAAEHGALLLTVDLFDGAAVDRLSRLQTNVAAAPMRLAARREELVAEKRALVDACDRFSRTVLSPRCEQLESSALAKVEEKLNQSFPDEDALRSAANRSTELTALAPTLEAAGRSAYEYSESIVRHAKLLFETWTAADAFEKRHLS
jgi:hypothetical protein